MKMLCGMIALATASEDDSEKSGVTSFHDSRLSRSYQLYCGSALGRGHLGMSRHYGFNAYTSTRPS
jgi:hypothetical protein